MKFFSKKRLSKGWFTGLVLGVASSAVLVYAASFPISFTPNTFSPNTTIRSDDVNANFGALFNCDGNDATDVMVRVGPLCVDKYEASVYTTLTGTTVATSAACSANGNDCGAIFARSVTGVPPAGNFTWFQAQQACANSGKRLLTNAEWQMAAAGTDAADGTSNANCNTGAGAQNTGNPLCASSFGVEDMNGNVWEWVGDWVQASLIPDSSAADPNIGLYGQDAAFNIGEAVVPGTTDVFPGALMRGGDSFSGTGAGIFAIAANFSPAGSDPNIGFRCAR